MDRLAIIANNDIAYKRMVDSIINSTLRQSANLKKVEGSIADLSIYMKEEGHDLILKNGQELLVLSRSAHTDE